MRAVSLIVAAMAAFLPATLVVATNSELSHEEVTKTLAHCESCHGANGDSTTPTVPRLNGQKSWYIESRLRSFRDVTRQDPHAIAAMWRISTKTGDQMTVVLSEYFADMAPTEPKRTKDRLAKDGEELFAHGVPAQQIPACTSCHGPHGEGTAMAPRLAGQHAAYLTHAMEVLHLALREHETMHPALNNIDEGQIKALAAYLARD